MAKLSQAHRNKISKSLKAFHKQRRGAKGWYNYYQLSSTRSQDPEKFEPKLLKK